MSQEQPATCKKEHFFVLCELRDGEEVSIGGQLILLGHDDGVEKWTEGEI
jgi:hypothetical protein